MAEIIENILEKTGGKDRSIRWFRDKIKELGDIPPRQARRAAGVARRTRRPGQRAAPRDGANGAHAAALVPGGHR